MPNMINSRSKWNGKDNLTAALGEPNAPHITASMTGAPIPRKNFATIPFPVINPQYPSDARAHNSIRNLITKLIFLSITVKNLLGVG